MKIVWPVLPVPPDEPARFRIVWPVLPVPPAVPPLQLRGLVCGVAAAALVLLLRLLGVAEGETGIVLTGVLLLLVPTSKELARRILYTGAIVMGWLPVLWWLDLPFAAVGRVTVLLALLAAGLAAWIGSGAQPLSRARALLPRVRAVDVALPIVATLGAMLLDPFLTTKQAVQSLAVLMTGWDNSAHFSMVSMARTHGVTVDALTTPPPSGGTWQFASYPEGFHALVATVGEILVGPGARDTATELLLYGRGTALVVLGAVLVVVAGICALPVARRRPIAVPAAVVAAAAFLVGPGADSVGGGFANFLLACVLTAIVALVVLPMPRVFLPVPFAAAAGALVGVANGWALLLAIAVPAAVALLLPISRSRWRTDRVRLIVVALVLVVTMLCAVRTAVVLMRVTAVDPLLIVGGIMPPDPGLVAAVSAGATAACLLAGRSGRLLAMAAAPLAGGWVAIALADAQYRASGMVTYYGYKFMTGLLLAALTIGVAAALHLLPRVRRIRGVAAVRAGVGALVLTAAATQVFGLTPLHPAIPDKDSAPVAPTFPAPAPGAPGVVTRARQIELISEPPTMAALSLYARDVQAQAGPRLVFYLDAPAKGGIDPLLAAQWYFALTDTWTVEANTAATRFRIRSQSAFDVADAARLFLHWRPDVCVAVPASDAARLRADLGPGLADRVLEVG